VRSRGARLRFAAATLVAVAAFLPPVAAAIDPAVERLAAAAGQAEPRIRIGLEPGARVEISASGAYRLIDPADGSSVWRKSFSGSLQVIVEGGPEGEPASIFRIQVGAFGSREKAEEELRRLQAAYGTSGVVRHDPDRGSWRVRLGSAADRISLNGLMERLRAGGVRDMWISEESAESIEGTELRLVDDDFDTLLSGRQRLVAVPVGRARIRVAGKPYRGIVELRIDDFGRVRPINWVELEKYLLGVVPSELGPEVWPELEALKAQAIAARTYAWKNLRQFEEEGFDLCATPRCQVYDGLSVEHPLSDRAVAETRNQVLTWKGEPIDALYTATCGGHTEDGGEIFQEQAAPYLSGVPCRAENEALASLRGTVRGRKAAPLVDETGVDVTRDRALLDVAGILTDDAGTLGVRPAPARLRAWTRELARRSGLPEPAGEPGPSGTLGEAAATLVADLGWSERAEVLLAEQDLEALLRDDEALQLPQDQRRALAYLAWVEGLAPYADGRFHADAAASGARLLPALARAAETYRALDLRSGVVSGMGAESMRLVRGKGEVRLPLAERPYLFGLAGGKTVTVERLELWPGDRVRYHVGDGGRIDFVELQPPVKGLSDDRSAKVYSWEARRTRRELEASINQRLSVGRLRDLRVLRRGVSGRVVELEVIGEKGSATVRGFDVRRLLGLRESLMVIEVQRDDRGRIEAVVFTGKGWGHGVGLCQVGAYGMALRGAEYREILAHYYRGTKIERPAGR
jgi:stage II sporulation protein D